jgi:hypothetical protein
MATTEKNSLDNLTVGFIVYVIKLKDLGGRVCDTLMSKP